MKPDRQLDRLIARQHGALNYRQARAAGLSESAVARRLTNGEWVQLAPGVYVVASSIPSWERQLSAALLSRPGSIAAGRSAAFLHRFTGFGKARPVIMAAKEANGRLNIARIIRIERFAEVAKTRKAGFEATSAAETLWTLARELPRRQTFDLIDESILLGRATETDLEAVLARVIGTRQKGLPNFRDAVIRTLPEADVVAANILEVHLYRMLSDPRVPAVRRQAPFLLEHQPARVDAYVEPWALIVEADGRNWHGRQSDFERDRKRDNALAARGIAVLRFTWRSLTEDGDECLRILLETGKHRNAMNVG